MLYVECGKRVSGQKWSRDLRLLACSDGRRGECASRLCCLVRVTIECFTTRVVTCCVVCDSLQEVSLSPLSWISDEWTDEITSSVCRNGRLIRVSLRRRLNDRLDACLFLFLYVC